MNGGSPIQRGRLARPVNRPGRQALSYRVGTYDGFVQEMLDRLVMALQAAPHEPAPDVAESMQRPVRLNVGSPDDWLVALVKSWATVADVLTFYQERIIQEGYLRTALEDRSVHELAQMIGYRPRPGVAGSADLAVSITQVKGLPNEIEMPARLVVRSVPPPGAEPQVFETIEGLRARAAWNVLRPPLSTVEQTPELTGAATGVKLLGTGNGLVVGSAILVTGTLAGAPVRIFRLLNEVKLQPGSPPYTEIGWAEPLAAGLDQESIKELEVLAFRQQNGLFGHNAPVWRELPPDVRQQYQTVEGGVLLSGGFGSQGGSQGWQPRNRGLPATAVIQCLAVDAEGNLFAGTAGDGIYRSTDGGANWKQSRRGLQQLDVQALIAGPHGVLFAGTPSGGVYRSTDQGDIWEVTSRGLLIGARHTLLGRKKQPAGPLPSTTVRALAAARWGDLSVLFAGTDSGVFRSTDSGRSWLPGNRGLPGTDPATGGTDLVVSALAAAPAVSGRDLIYAGTARGVFKSTDGGRRWQPVSRGIPATDPFSGVSLTAIRSLVVYPDRRRGTLNLFAGTGRGLFRSTDGGDHWQRADLPVAGGIPEGAREVLCLAVLDDRAALVTRVLAGLPEGLWSSIDDGETWSPVHLGGASRVDAVAAGPDGTPVVVATPLAGFSSDWPGFRIQGNQIDLDGLVPGLAAGSWIALRPGEAAGASTVGVYRIRKVYPVQRREFSLTATVTRIEVADPDPLLAAFDLRQTRAYLQTEALSLRPRTRSAVTAAVGVLRAELLTLPSRRKVIVLGRTLPVAFSAVSTPANEISGKLASLRDDLAVVSPQSEVTVRVWLGSRGERLPDVQERMPASKLQEILSALTAQVRSGAASLVPHPAAETGQGSGTGRLAAALGSPKLWSSSLLVTLEVEVAGDLTGMTLLAGDLADSLSGPKNVSPPGDEHPIYVVRIPRPGTTDALVLDASTLQVHGNVVAATEGVTVAGEVLGDGDAAAANQTFTLAQPPSFMRDTDGVKSTLAVYVQRQLWEEVLALYGSDGESRVYRTRLDPLGRATLIFGSGWTGARLPSGRDNVVATYRTGMSSRSVPAGGLSLLATRPLGLDAVNNPLSTTPGALAEGREEIRWKAPRTLRTLGRIVSLQDFEDFALDFPGIEKARAWGMIIGGSQAVQITLAAAGGEPIPEGGGLILELLDAIHRSRALDTPVYLQSYRAVRVLTAANVQVAPGFLWDDVRKDILAAVADEFGFARSRFGGGISAAAVVSAMQRVRGVQGVDLDSFSWAGRSGGGEDPRERRAAPPSWDPAARELVPAELVFLDPPALRGYGAP
jgi:photosystem II stability/assembly factor-like uncharacterized protein